jgi:6-phosphogluconolactonase (cycloisomerase 2 family)
MPSRRFPIVLVVVLAFALAVPGSGAAVELVGGLTPLAGPGGCLTIPDSGEQRQQPCAGRTQFLDGPASLLISGGDRSLYVASPQDNTVLALASSPSTGQLSLPEKPSTRDCVGAPGVGCAEQTLGLEGVDALAASPGGADVYAGSATGAAVVALRRGASGLLTPLPARTGRGRKATYGCIDGMRLAAAAPHPCANTSGGLAAVQALAVSPNGRDVYAVSSGLAAGRDSVVALARNPRTGSLSALTGPGSCIESMPGDVCESSTRGLEGADAIVISPDGRFLYVASSLSGAVVGFSRNAHKGTLSPLAGPGGCVSQDNHTPPGGDLACSLMAPQLSGARALALSPDGDFLYVLAFDPGALVALPRNPTTGMLGVPTTPSMCLSAFVVSSCQTVAALRGGFAMVASPTGRALYVSAQGGDALMQVLVDPATGALEPATLGASPFGELGDPGALAMSVTGNSLYLASPVDDALAGFSVG